MMSQEEHKPKAPVLDSSQIVADEETVPVVETNTENEPRIPVDFEAYKSFFKQNLAYVEDDSFSWDSTIAYLVLPLSETDSVNKVRGRSNATNIQITDSIDTQEGENKADDFLPSLVVNGTFPGWRLEVKARMHRANIEQLKGNRIEEVTEWIDSQIEIKRRPNLNAGQNPVIHICYLDDLEILRKQLWPHDYLILVKQKGKIKYEAFGLKNNAPLVQRKTLIVSQSTGSDQSTFILPEVVQQGRDRIVSYVRVMEGSETEDSYKFILNEDDPIYSPNDEIWVYNKSEKSFVEITKVSSLNHEENSVSVIVEKRIFPPLSLDRVREIEEMGDLLSYVEAFDNGQEPAAEQAPVAQQVQNPKIEEEQRVQTEEELVEEQKPMEEKQKNDQTMIQSPTKN